MGSLKALTIKSKLMVMLLTVSICSLLVISYLGYSSGKANLTDRVFNQLTSLRATKQEWIESYFRSIRNQSQTFADDRMFATAMKAFKTAYNQLEQAEIPEEYDASIAAYYQNEFLPRLAETTEGQPVLNAYIPKESAARYLQYHYVSENPHPVGEKHHLNDAGDGSDYSKVHAYYHPIFQELAQKFSYFDIFLIDPDTGAIVYTVSKETDYATSLEAGPYSETNLADVVNRTRQSKILDYVAVADFQPYAPSYGAPAAFIASPIYEGSDLLGILAFQMPVDKINDIMTGHRNWEANGMGESGETYLVGPDYRMRSVSRFLIEDAESYENALRNNNVSERTIKRIEQYKTSILQQEVKTLAAEEALAGRTGTMIIDDYLGVHVLSAYAPLHIEGLNWAIISKMNLSEAYAPIYSFQKAIFISMACVILLITLAAMRLATIFVKPIDLLVKSTRQLEAEEIEAITALRSEDEFGELAESMNHLVGTFRKKFDQLERKNRESDALLLNVFPSSIAQRLKSGERDIVDQVSNVSVLISDLVGFTELTKSISADEALATLNALITAFDEATERCGVEKVKTIGDSYMAACGLLTPCLEHDKRIMDFALEMQAIVQRFNYERDFHLDLKIGVHSGDVVAGIVGYSRFSYDVWGEAIDLTEQLKSACPKGGILVSQTLYDRAQDLYEFREWQTIELGPKGHLTTWILGKTWAEELTQKLAISHR